MTIDDFIEAHRGAFSVDVLCAAIGHRRSTYYARRNRPESARAVRDVRLAKDIASVRQGHNRSRGRRNVKEALARKGRVVSERRIGRVMKAEGWYGVPRSSRPKPSLPVPVVPYQDLVRRVFRASAPNRLWWGDVKEVATDDGPLYLASLQDAFSRYIVGFAFSACNDTDLAAAALTRAARRRRPTRGLIHHTDHGSPTCRGPTSATSRTSAPDRASAGSAIPTTTPASRAGTAPCSVNTWHSIGSAHAWKQSRASPTGSATSTAAGSIRSSAA